MIYWPNKTAAEAIDVGADWGPTLSQLDDPTIITSAWARLSGDAAFNAVGAIIAGRETVTRISGGTAGTESIFRNTVTLSDGQVLTEDAFIKVR